MSDVFFWEILVGDFLLLIFSILGNAQIRLEKSWLLDRKKVVQKIIILGPYKITLKKFLIS